MRSPCAAAPCATSWLLTPSSQSALLQPSTTSFKDRVPGLATARTAGQPTTSSRGG